MKTRPVIRRKSFRRLLSALMVIAVCTGGYCIAYAQDAVWNGGTGLWSVASNWTPATIPNGASYNVFIDGGKTGVTSTVTLDVNASIASLTIDANSSTPNDKLIIGSGISLTLTGAADVVNNGTIELAPSSAETRLMLGASSVVFSGTGEIVLGAGDNGIRSRISSLNANYVLVNDTGHTIRGAGFIGENNLILTNRGTITADNSSYSLIINPSASGTSTNTGTLQATGGATLQLWNRTYTNTGGTILATGAGSAVLLVGATIAGGNLTTANNGVIATAGGNTGALDGITLTSGSSFVGQSGSITYLRNTITNQGTMTITGINADTYFYVNDSSVTLTGSGSVVLEPGDNGQRSRISSTDAAYTLVNDTNHTISGAGYVGINNLGLTNRGTITADRASAPLIIAPSGTSTNTGTLQATGGATLQLWNRTYTNTGGTILATGAGSAVLLVGATIAGGNLTTANNGVIATAGGNTGALDGITLTSGSSFVGQSGSITYLRNTITNQGTMTIGAPAGNADTRFYVDSSSVTLTGGGTLVLNPGDNGIRSRISSSNVNYVLVNDTGSTIRGAGYVGVNDLGLINRGTIIADNSTYPLSIYPSTSSLNNLGTLRATNGATLIVGNANFQNLSGTTLTGGTYEVFANSTMRLPAATGIVTNASTILLDGANSSVQRVSDSADALTPYFTTNAAAGRFTIQNSRTFTMAAGLNFSNAGIVTIGSGSLFTSTGTFTNTGSGVLQMRGGTIGTAASGLIVDGAAAQIDGWGTATSRVVNNGGTVRASGGTLNLNQGVQSTPAGLVQVDSGSTLFLTGNSSSAGTLIHNGSSAGSLNLGNPGYNLTVYTDYQNANFGTGNSFNARANVSGSGLILASGDVGLSLSGAGIIGGTTDTPTLALGNVHAGVVNSGSVTINNTGTNGPALRGAVQNTGITDPGFGLTAQNFGPVALGGSTTVSYTYTPAAGGALSGQTFNVVTNFDNVAGKTVTVTGTAYNLAAGSAAPSPLVFANRRVGTTAEQYLTVTNTAPAGPYTEGLNANFGTATGAAQNVGGPIIRLAGGAFDSSTMGVRLDTSTAGAKTGTVTLNYVSDGTGTSGLGITELGSQTINVSGNVYNVAVGSTTPTPVTVANQRVGGTAGQLLTVSNTAPAGIYSEALNASFSGTSGDATTNGGSVMNLIAGGSNSTAMSVGVNTATAGAKSGTVTLAYQTDGTGPNGNSGLAAISAGSQIVSVSGSVYQVAQPTLASNNIVFTNRHVGDAATQSLTITNTSAAPTGYQEGLNVSFSGTSSGITGSGTITNLAQGASSTALAVGIDTSTAGAKSGTATLALASNGSGTSGLTELTLAPQTVNVSGSVYRLANAVINNAGSFSFGNVHVGDPVLQALSITNSVADDGYSERLNASFGGTTDGRITASGSITQLAAGATNASSMVLGVNTAAAGAVNGTATVNFASDGTGTSGLGITALPSQDVTVTATIEGGVYRLASPVIQTAQPVDFGNVRLGTAVTPQALSILNNVPNDGFSESLNASANGTTGGVTASGSFNLLAPQAVSTAIQVGLDTSVAGNRSGTATINFQSDGTGTSGLGITNLPSQNVQVTGNVYRLANPVLNTPGVTLAARVGDASPTASISLTNSSPDVYTEGLNVARGATATGFTSSGSIGNLAAGQTSANAIQVALNTGTAGSFTGTQALAYVSTGAGTTLASDVSVGSGSVSLAGRVYTPAVASVGTTPIDFGIVHVGDVVASRNVAVTNAAAATALNDVLVGSIGTSGASSFTASGNLGSGLGAGQTNNTSLNVQLNTSIAGIYSGAANLALSSRNADMADLPLATSAIALRAQVNNYANPVYNLVTGDGTLSGSGFSFTLDFGEVVQNAAAETATLRLLNSVLGPADLLEGSFSFDVALFALSGFTSFTGLGAGQGLDGLVIAMNTDSLGTFSETITLNAFGYNASGYRGAIEVSLLVRGSVVEGSAVPEPSTIILIGLGLAGLAAVRRRFRG